jgi:hypothetical protein
MNKLEQTEREMRAGRRALLLSQLMDYGVTKSKVNKIFMGLPVATTLAHDPVNDRFVLTLKVTAKDGTFIEFQEPLTEFPSDHLVAKLGLLS